MSKVYINEKTFDKADFSTAGMTATDYENCVFTNCNFSNVDLSGLTFFECKFNGCDLSLAKLSKTAFKDVKFKDCKLLGLRFENCSEFLFSVNFEGCNLNLSTFFKKSLKKTHFANCILQETDFTESDLSAAIGQYYREKCSKYPGSNGKFLFRDQGNRTLSALCVAYGRQ